MLTYIYSSKCIGIDAIKVTVEVDITPGIGIHLVGLADAAVKESLLRTVTALKTLGFRIPGKSIVINLAPADMYKNGSGYDVPIAIGIISASGQRELPLTDRYMIMGELGLDGTVRSVPGALPTVELAGREGFKGCILPDTAAAEAIEYGGLEVYGVSNLEDVMRILSGGDDCRDLLVRNKFAHTCGNEGSEKKGIMDFSEILGQEGAKRGLEIAAAGGHNVIMIGPPGSGKSSLAKAMGGILPPMSIEESIQTSKIYSVAGKGRSQQGLIRERPFRAPHYSSSVPAIIGGGSENIMPGEITLAHNGILFLDEFCEIPKRVIEALREPMEDRRIVISRLRSKIEYPASFMLVAATNPCPCGYYGKAERCTCTPGKRRAYLSKLSGPIMDRIDIHLWLNSVETSKLVNRTKAECSAAVAERVSAARAVQRERFRDEDIFTNAEMSWKIIERHCAVSAGCRRFMERLVEGSGLSARAFMRIMKLARTIADLDGAEDIGIRHLSEAAGYRFLDRKDLEI